MEDEEERKRRMRGNEMPEEKEPQDLKHMDQLDKVRSMIEKKLEDLRRRAADPKTSEEEKKKLRDEERRLEAALRQTGDQQVSAQDWRRLADSDQMKAIIEAIADGKPIPDTQWNRLLSTLDKGLWQVRGRIPPEDYRKAIEQYQDQIRQILNAEK